ARRTSHLAGRTSRQQDQPGRPRRNPLTSHGQRPRTGLLRNTLKTAERLPSRPHPRTAGPYGPRGFGPRHDGPEVSGILPVIAQSPRDEMLTLSNTNRPIAVASSSFSAVPTSPIPIFLCP